MKRSPTIRCSRTHARTADERELLAVYRRNHDSVQRWLMTQARFIDQIAHATGIEAKSLARASRRKGGAR